MYFEKTNTAPRRLIMYKTDSFISADEIKEMANSQSSSGASSDWWIWVIFAIVVGVCPPIGILIMIIAFLVK